MGIECDFETKLVWEDDARRDGMRRRGPPRTKSTTVAAHAALSLPSSSSQARAKSSEAGHNADYNPTANDMALVSSIQSSTAWDPGRQHRLSDWPFELDQVESQLLNNYIQRFSRTYPAFSGPTNPFLRVFLPLSMRSRAVMNSVLALSAVQSWENGGFSMETSMLRLRLKALRGSADLVANIMSRQNAGDDALSPATSLRGTLELIADRAIVASGEEVLHLLASCTLLLLYEKISGDSRENGTGHLQLFARLFPLRLFLAVNTNNPTDSRYDHWNEPLRFLSSLFMYNDLVRSTSFRTPTLVSLHDIGLSQEDASHIQHIGSGSHVGRFDFPNMLGRISIDAASVSDQDIAEWDGRLDWFPSFALVPPERREVQERLPTADPAIVLDSKYAILESLLSPVTLGDEQSLCYELYRVAATTYRKQCAIRQELAAHSGDGPLAMRGRQAVEMGNLSFWAIQLIALLPPGCPLENVLLWPIGIVAQELTLESEREYVLFRLKSLEDRYAMRHFYVVREHLTKIWALADQGLICADKQPTLFG